MKRAMRSFRKLFSSSRRPAGVVEEDFAAKRVSAAELQRQRSEYDEWRRQNPTASFKEFYSEGAQKLHAEGVLHTTTGANLRGGPFETRGYELFEKFVEYGLKPTDCCVDYGCGTLRVGQHVMKYLQPGRYWGMEIADWLLEEGKTLIGPELLAEKKPNLCVISPEAVAQAAAIKANMVFSIKVLQHVHPDELSEYFGNIMAMMDPSGQAIIASSWADRTIQYRVNGWAHDLSVIEKLVSGIGGELTVLQQKGKTLPLEGAGTGKKGFLRIVRR